MNLRTVLMVSMTALSLTACASKPAADLYVLRVPEAAVSSCSSPRALIVDRPSAPNEYDTKRIAVMLGKNHLSYYTGANWASPFPEQLQGFLSDAFTQQGITVMDGSTDDTLNVRTLHIAIHEANITNVSSPIVRLRLTGTISNPSGRATRFKVNEEIAAEENHMPQIIDAYDQAALNAATTITKAMKLHCSGT